MLGYLAQAVGRGVLQGRFRFGRIVASLFVEMGVRLVVGVAGARRPAWCSTPELPVVEV